MIQTSGFSCAGDGRDDADLLELMCAWCRRVKDAHGQWIERTLDTDTTTISHGICPDCERQTLNAAERRRGRASSTGGRTPAPVRVDGDAPE